MRMQPFLTYVAIEKNLSKRDFKSVDRILAQIRQRDVSLKEEEVCVCLVLTWPFCRDLREWFDLRNECLSGAFG